MKFCTQCGKKFIARYARLIRASIPCDMPSVEFCICHCPNTNPQ